MKYKNGKEGNSNREQSTVKSKFTDGKYFGRRSKFYFFSIKIEYNLHTNKLDYKIYIYIYIYIYIVSTDTCFLLLTTHRCGSG